jgi:hypothetical protein
LHYWEDGSIHIGARSGQSGEGFPHPEERQTRVSKDEETYPQRDVSLVLVLRRLRRSRLEARERAKHSFTRSPCRKMRPHRTTLTVLTSPEYIPIPPVTPADRKGRFRWVWRRLGGGADPVGRRPSFLPAAPSPLEASPSRGARISLKSCKTFWIGLCAENAASSAISEVGAGV